MNSEEFRETFLRNDREGPTKAEKAEKMAENNAWEGNSRRGISQGQEKPPRLDQCDRLEGKGAPLLERPRERQARAVKKKSKEKKQKIPREPRVVPEGAGGERPEKHSCSRPRGRARRPRERRTPHMWGCCMCLHAPSGRVT